MPQGEPSTKIHPGLLEAMRQGKLILAPAERIARTLRRAYDQTQQGRPTWTPANVLTLEAWLPALWHHLLITGHETRTLLNRTQEQSLWRTMLAADPEVSTVRSLDSLARLAAEAWRTLHLHNGRQHLRDFTASTDSRAFARWASAFERHCNRERLLSPAGLPAALTAALDEGTLPVPNSGLTLVDFETLIPAHDTLIRSIRQAGYEVSHLQTTIPAQPTLHRAADDKAELRTAAWWCRVRLAQEPAARIAVVLPNQTDRRPQLERVFAEMLAAAAGPITAADADPVFEFSLGQPLSSTEPCAAALDLLRWTLYPLPLGTISDLLLSPFCGGSGPEALAAAAFDVTTLRQRKLLTPELSLEDFLGLLQRNSVLPALRQRLYGLRHETSEPTTRQTHGAWADAFRTMLESAGWTAATRTDSVSYQISSRFESALDELSTLDFDGSLVSAAEAVASLAAITEQTTFAPESTNAPVQILGPLELGGVPFDALWVLGADDLTWPSPPPSHPLIPWNIQSAVAIPGADRTRDGLAAGKLTDRVSANAPEVVFSYAAQSETGPRRPSKLVADFPPVDFAPPQPGTHQTPTLFEDTLLVSGLPDRPIRGGATVLADQAACPFRSFAEHRLHSAAPETRTAGLDPRDRGNIVHLVMEAFWAEVRDQPNLRRLTAAGRDEILDRSIEHALARFPNPQTSWERAYVAVQHTRLQQLLRPWLDAERERPPFEVRQREEKREVTVGPLRLHLRVDRVDQTEPGPLILDYKTGAAAPSDWQGERPDAPQLPLYAAFSPEPVAGVAFALLRAGNDMGLKGYADDPAVLTRSSRNNLSLPEQVEDWTRILTQLAGDFASAEAAVDPKAYPTTCKHCSQRILCRLDPTTLEDTEDEDREAAFV